MSMTLAAVFDSDVEAQKACEKLEKAGIDEQSIRVTASTPPSTAPEPEDHRSFFQKLFSLGDDETSSGTYLEAVSRGNPVVTVQLADESRVDEVSDMLDDCGAIDIDERAEQWKATGYQPPPVTGKPMPAGDDSQTMTSVDEQMKVGKRAVQKGRVRVYRTMTEKPVEENVTLHDEKASIERKKVDRPATDAEMQAAFKDKDIEIRETSEEPVVSKSAHVTEEVTVGKKSSDRTESVKGNVRSTEIDVENLSDVPASMHKFSGAERRHSPSGGYKGPERRAGY